MEGRVGHVMLLCFTRVPHISTWSIDHSSLHTNEAKSLTENVVVSNTNVVITEKKSPITGQNMLSSTRFGDQTKIVTTDHRLTNFKPLFLDQ